jgi:hypothetical protein
MPKPTPLTLRQDAKAIEIAEDLIRKAIRARRWYVSCFLHSDITLLAKELVRADRSILETAKRELMS